MKSNYDKKKITQQAYILYLQHRVQILARSSVFKGKARRTKERVKVKHLNNINTQRHCFINFTQNSSLRVKKPVHDKKF